MASDIYGFDDLSYGVQGWNGILQTNFETVEEYLHTYLRYKVDSGEAVTEGMPLQLRQSHWIEAKADGTLHPASAIAVEAGSSGEYVRGRRVGPMKYSGWSFDPSGEVWLAPTGGVTQTEPGSNVQVLGCAIAETAMIVQL